MGGVVSKPSRKEPPKPKPVPVVQPTVDNSADAEAERLRKLKGASGRRTGLTDQAQVQRKGLLGE